MRLRRRGSLQSNVSRCFVHKIENALSNSSKVKLNGCRVKSLQHNEVGDALKYHVNSKLSACGDRFSFQHYSSRRRVAEYDRHFLAFWSNCVVYACVRRRIDGCVARYRALQYGMQFKPYRHPLSRSRICDLEGPPARRRTCIITCLHD